MLRYVGSTKLVLNLAARLLLLFGLTGFSACSSSPYVRACELAIKAVIKSPSSYQHVDHQNTITWYVLITFDATDDSGEQISSWATCEFEPNSEELTLRKFALNGMTNHRWLLAAQLAVVETRFAPAR